jgi:outer membrane protein assembly factor BamB
VLSAVKTEKTVEPAAESSHDAMPAPEVLPAAYRPQEQVQEQTPEQQQTPQRPPAQQRRRRPPPENPTHVHQFMVSAFDRGTGKTLWQKVVREEVPHEAGHSTASQASASPVTDGEHVWASFGSRGLYCLDMNGEVKWERDLGKMETRNQFGEGASPALHGDTLVVNWDHEGDSFIVALNKKTGKELWRVTRDEPTSWSTPLIVEDGDRALVVVSASNRVRAYDVKNGEVAWEVGGLGLNCIPSPVAADGMLFAMSGYREAAGMGIRYAGAKGDITESDHVAWRTDRGLSYVPSPLLHDGKLYFLKRFGGILTSLDLKTGSVVYEEQRVDGVENVYASPVAAAGRIYLIDRGGNAVVFRAGAEYELLAQSKLDDAFDASPVIVGDTIYLRGHEHLYAVGAP